MPRYYFHVRNGATIADPEGSEIAGGLHAVQREAALHARDVMADGIRQGLDYSGRTFEIEDEDGRTVMSFPFKQALRPA